MISEGYGRWRAVVRHFIKATDTERSCARLKRLVWPIRQSVLNGFSRPQTSRTVILKSNVSSGSGSDLGFVKNYNVSNQEWRIHSFGQLLPQNTDRPLTANRLIAANDFLLKNPDKT